MIQAFSLPQNTTSRRLRRPERHRRLESQLGFGSTFTVTLPLHATLPNTSNNNTTHGAKFL